MKGCALESFSGGHTQKPLMLQHKPRNTTPMGGFIPSEQHAVAGLLFTIDLAFKNLDFLSCAARCHDIF